MQKVNSVGVVHLSVKGDDVAARHAVFGKVNRNISVAAVGKQGAPFNGFGGYGPHIARMRETDVTFYPLKFAILSGFYSVSIVKILAAKVDRRAYYFKVILPTRRQIFFVNLKSVFGILAEQNRVKPPSNRPAEPVAAVGCFIGFFVCDVDIGLVFGIFRIKIRARRRIADFYIVPHFTHSVYGHTVGKHYVMRHTNNLAGAVMQIRGVAAAVKSVADKALRFVKGYEMLYAVAERLDTNPCVIGKPLGRLGIKPSTLIEKLIRIVPMEKCYVGLNAVGNKLVNKVIVIFYPLFINLADAVRHNTGPRDRKTVALKPHFLHGGNVLFITMIAVAGDVARVPCLYFSAALTVGIPNGQALSVLVCAALYLI